MCSLKFAFVQVNRPEDAALDGPPEPLVLAAQNLRSVNFKVANVCCARENVGTSGLLLFGSWKRKKKGEDQLEKLEIGVETPMLIGANLVGNADTYRSKSGWKYRYLSVPNSEPEMAMLIGLKF